MFNKFKKSIATEVAKMSRDEILSKAVDPKIILTDSRTPTNNERRNTKNQLTHSELKKYVHRHIILMERRFKETDCLARNVMAHHHPYWRRYIKGVTTKLNFNKIRIVEGKPSEQDSEGEIDATKPEQTDKKDEKADKTKNEGNGDKTKNEGNGDKSKNEENGNKTNDGKPKDGKNTDPKSDDGKSNDVLFDSDKTDPKERTDLMDWYLEERIDEAVEKIRNKSLTHGIAVYQPLLADIPEWYSGPKWYVRAADEMEETHWEHGHPTRWMVSPSNKHLGPYELKIQDCVFFDPHGTDDFDGESCFIGLWDEGIQYIFLDDAHQAFLQRVGHGFLVMVVPNGTTQTDWDKYEDTIQHIRVKGGLIVRGDVDEPVVIQWLKVEGGNNTFETYFADFDKKFALHTQMPKRLLFGDQEGAMESSGKDRLQAQSSLKDEFEKWIRVIKLILLKHGKISKLNEVDILPNFAMDKSDVEKLTEDGLKVDNIAKRSWITDDEKRAMDGLPPMTDEQIDDIAENANDPAAQGAFGVQGQNGAKKPKPGESSRNKPPNASKAKKTDGLIKLKDSMKITGRKVTFDECILITPKSDPTYIDDVTIVLSKENIKRWFDRVGPKEFHLGMNPPDVHYDSDIYLDESVGVAVAMSIDSDGWVRGRATFDLDLVEGAIGPDNWLEKLIEQNGKPSISLGRISRTQRVGENTLVEYDIDVRGFLITQNPRNPETKLQ